MRSRRPQCYSLQYVFTYCNFFCLYGIDFTRETFGAQSLLTIIRNSIIRHIKDNIRTYLVIMLAFSIGIMMGCITVNKLNMGQREELGFYFKGFLQLFSNQSINSNEVFKISLMDHGRIVLILWVLGVTIVGVPLIFLVIGIRGFITGFCSGFVIESLGLRGVLFSFLILLPKELIVLPCQMALAVSGINFSRKILHAMSSKKPLRDSFQSSILAYTSVTLFYSVIMLVGIFFEAYIGPLLLRAILPLFTSK